MNETSAATSSTSGSCECPAWCPLNQVKAGMRVVIRKLGGSPEVSHRLRELGMCEDRMIRLINRSTNIVCQVCNARLALNEQLAASILVEPMGSLPRTVMG